MTNPPMVPALALMVPGHRDISRGVPFDILVGRYGDPSLAKEIFPHPNVAEPSVFSAQ